ncbi:RagB/SusD family nutrient uptake outer membrane protein [Anditalea andensis]|uniref:Carbohydrate-binding protein SusD n=1 Tax=Anditalea andensis TaxID=1048983 RepID=A0A074L182_9BACT|nr:RagB/SusD family nutrient uptake outer membrane protein [Anditalea andensis]KEO74235.1 hypothetical protein EL17_08870 [Anditalea andensis]
MKVIYTTYKALLLFLGGMLLNSCSSEFLEIVPKGRLIAEKTGDYHKMFYNLRLVNMGATNAHAPLSDELVAIEPFFSSSQLRTQRLYRWEADIYETEQNSSELEITMENLYIYNKIINEVLQSTEGSEQEKLSLQAEALGGRAWTYFLLINYFGMPYNAATAASDPGFPMVIEADLVARNFQRASVAEIYDLIVRDLTTAIPNLPVEVVSRMRFSRAAGKALLGKVYTFMGRYADAAPLLRDAITEMGSMGISTGLYDYNDGYSSQLTVNDRENLYSKQFVNNWVHQGNEYVLKPEVAALYHSTDLRLRYQYRTTAQNGAQYPVPGILRRVLGSGQAQFGVRASELYLLDAEVKCRLNDLPGAVASLEFFRSHRMPEQDAKVPAAIASDQISLLRFIFEERLREFAVLGYRWFDIRRLSVDPLIPLDITDLTHRIYNADGTVKETFNLTRNRLVLKFPQTVMDQNPGMINNN